MSPETERKMEAVQDALQSNLSNSINNIKMVDLRDLTVTPKLGGKKILRKSLGIVLLCIS